ncbi:hypothetical protein [Parasediminibacterium sp. JCM 36343]|uniref:hypothetical protein n=1 Tax=Parasediminibacterium sp. JCM 36343 TaxID=3374279 RepID=UPI0039795771
MELTQGQVRELDRMIRAALDETYDRHMPLIAKAAHERPIAFWFGLHFHPLVEASSFKEEGIFIDFDCDLNGADPKAADGIDAFTQIILHHRGDSACNIAMIQFKTHWNASASRDIRELRKSTLENSKHGYGLGVSVTLKKSIVQAAGKVRYFIKGEEVFRHLDFAAMPEAKRTANPKKPQR